MSELEFQIGEDLSSYYEMIRQQVHQWVDPLTEEQLWTNPFSFGNSVGHLLLHMTGNLNYYIGSQIAETGYVRDRDREFTEVQRKSKEHLLADYDRTIAMVVDTIRKQAPDGWLRPYSGKGEPAAKERFHAFLRCAGHAYHHVGQLIYLSRELRK